MFGSVLTVALTVAASAGTGQVMHGGGYADGGFAGGYNSEQRYAYDAPEPWLHGYIQEIPAYGGFSAFRPYNYKHVLAQSQAAGGWGMSPSMPYSQQFWHRYHQQAAMMQMSQYGDANYQYLAQQPLLPPTQHAPVMYQTAPVSHSSFPVAPQQTPTNPRLDDAIRQLQEMQAGQR